MATTEQTIYNHDVQGPGEARSDPSRKLRLLLRINGAFSTVTGAIGLIAAVRVADFVGVEQVWLIRLLGVGLLGFATAVFGVARAGLANLDLGSRIISLNDLGWVAGTIAVLAFGWLTSAGAITMGLIALVVLDLGLAQMWARRKMLTA